MLKDGKLSNTLLVSFLVAIQKMITRHNYTLTPLQSCLNSQWDELYCSECFSDRQALANGTYPNQTAPEGPVSPVPLVYTN